MPTTNEIERYAEFGRAAVIPGIQAAIDVLEGYLENLRTELAAAQGRAILPTVQMQTLNKRTSSLNPNLTVNGKPRKMHPRDPSHPEHEEWIKKLSGAHRRKKNKQNSRAAQGYWANMTPEERSQEMARRVKVRIKNAARLAKLENVA